MTEIWKDINGYEGLYEVSNYGNFKSSARITSDGRKLKERIISGGFYPNGYQYLNLRKDGINKTFLAHRLVAIAFVPNPDNLPVVNHENGVKFANYSSNLKWSTQSDNLKHAVEIGLMESQCKIRRSVSISKGLTIINFKTMKECCEFFNHTKCWLGNKIKQVGNPFRYEGWVISVDDREVR